MNSAHTNQEKSGSSGTLCYCLLAAAALVMTIAASGCGGGSSNPMNSNLSAPQAQAVSGQVVQAVTAALTSAFSKATPALDGARPSLSTVLADAHPDTASSGCTSTPTGQSCNLPLSYTGPCSGGGTISVTGDIGGTLDSSGDGSFSTQMTITPSSCSVSGTVFNGNPDITIAGQIGFTNSNFAYPITFMEGGGISYGPNPSGSCQVNVTYTLNASSCSVTGTVCGQSVNGSC
ncbi:MAG: hypothetical protein ACYDDS_16855 [Candidatus Sulfotelmatobacter sp.]